MFALYSRRVYGNQIVFDQADFFQPDEYTRVVGLTVSDLGCELYFNNQLMSWSFVSGVGVPDAQVASGKIYWMEIAGSPGRYSMRWRPSAVGYWRMLITYPAGTQIVGREYDVIPPPNADQGLKTSFLKPGCA